MNTLGKTVRINLLGPVEVISTNRVITFGAPRLRTFLAALALANGRLVSDDQMALYLWGSLSPATPTAQLFSYASRLRTELGQCISIIRTGSGYQLDPQTIEVDADRFGRLAQQAHDLLDRGDPAAAAGLIQEALALWRGPALAGVTEPLRSVGIALDAMRLELSQLRSAVLLRLDRPDRLAGRIA